MHSICKIKVALDGGTRPGDTLQILPLALAQPPNPRSITSHSVLRGHPSHTHRVFFFQGHSVGHSFAKDNKWNCNLFFRKICISDEKIINTHIIYIYMYINLLYSLGMCNLCNYYMYLCIFICIYILHTLKYVFLCVCA